MRTCLLLALLGSGTVHAAEGGLLVVGYQPFAGRGKNGSETLVQALARDARFASVRFRVLAVEWKAVDRLIEDIRADPTITGVIGLGEGYPGFICIETRGRNQAAGSDETGAPPPGAVIAATGPATNASRLRYQAAGSTVLPVALGVDAGDFLCNYALYRYNQLPLATSGFIHLPPQETQADSAYLEQVAAPVAGILLQNLTP